MMKLYKKGFAKDAQNVWEIYQNYLVNKFQKIASNDFLRVFFFTPIIPICDKLSQCN